MKWTTKALLKAGAVAVVGGMLIADIRKSQKKVSVLKNQHYLKKYVAHELDDDTHVLEFLENLSPEETEAVTNFVSIVKTEKEKEKSSKVLIEE